MRTRVCEGGFPYSLWVLFTEKGNKGLYNNAILHKSKKYFMRHTLGDFPSLSIANVYWSPDSFQNQLWSFTSIDHFREKWSRQMQKKYWGLECESKTGPHKDQSHDLPFNLDVWIWQGRDPAPVFLNKGTIVGNCN